MVKVFLDKVRTPANLLEWHICRSEDQAIDFISENFAKISLISFGEDFLEVARYIREYFSNPLPYTFHLQYEEKFVTVKVTNKEGEKEEKTYSQKVFFNQDYVRRVDLFIASKKNGKYRFKQYETLTEKDWDKFNLEYWHNPMFPELDEKGRILSQEKNDPFNEQQTYCSIADSDGYCIGVIAKNRPYDSGILPHNPKLKEVSKASSNGKKQEKLAQMSKRIEEILSLCKK